jgi:hypothetical protein
VHVYVHHAALLPHIASSVLSPQLMDWVHLQHLVSTAAAQLAAADSCFEIPQQHFG